MQTETEGEEGSQMSPTKMKAKKESLKSITQKTKVLQISPEKPKGSCLHKGFQESFSSSDAKWLLDFEP